MLVKFLAKCLEYRTCCQVLAVMFVTFLITMFWIVMFWKVHSFCIIGFSSIGSAIPLLDYTWVWCIDRKGFYKFFARQGLFLRISICVAPWHLVCNINTHLPKVVKKFLIIGFMTSIMRVTDSLGTWIYLLESLYIIERFLRNKRISANSGEMKEINILITLCGKSTLFVIVLWAFWMLVRYLFLYYPEAR